MKPTYEDRKEQMEKLKSQGWTYAEIAQMFGVTRQRVYQIIGGHYNTHFKRVTEEKCIYPNLLRFLNENRISMRELTRLVYGYYHRASEQRIRMVLKGADCHKSLIDKMLDVTRLSYEEAFKRKEDENAVG